MLLVLLVLWVLWVCTCCSVCARGVVGGVGVHVVVWRVRACGMMPTACAMLNKHGVCIRHADMCFAVCCLPCLHPLSVCMLCLRVCFVGACNAVVRVTLKAVNLGMRSCCHAVCVFAPVCYVSVTVSLDR